MSLKIAAPVERVYALASDPEIVPSYAPEVARIEVMQRLSEHSVLGRSYLKNDYFAVIEPVFLSVSIYDGPMIYERDLARFSKERRYVLACHWYLSEVNNGGHDQFYDNSTGIVWKDASEGFIAIGAKEVAASLTNPQDDWEAVPVSIGKKDSNSLSVAAPNLTISMTSYLN